MTFLAQPNERGCKAQKAQIASGELVKPGEDSTIVLDLVDEAFNHMAFSIEMGVIGASLFSISLGRNDWNGTGCLNQCNDIISVIALVSNDKVAAPA